MIKVTGINEIDAVLKGLPDQVNNKVMQAANVYAAKPLIEKAKLLAPEGPTGSLVDSIGAIKSPSASSTQGVGQIQVGPRRRGGYKGFHGHLVEYGTKTRSTRTSNANRGRMTANPFMEKAFDQTKDEVLKRINDGVGKALYSFMKRTIKNA